MITSSDLIQFAQALNGTADDCMRAMMARFGNATPTELAGALFEAAVISRDDLNRFERDGFDFYAVPALLKRQAE